MIDAGNSDGGGTGYAARPRRRAVPALIAAGLTAGVGALLLAGLDLRFAPVAQDTLAIFVVAPPAPPPPPPPPAPRKAAPKKAGAASPPNLKAKATPVVQPSPVIPVPAPPPPIVTAPTPAAGRASNAGAALVAGPGTGSGGVGDGTGSGGMGDGPGGGGGEPSAYRSGTLRDSDLPERLARQIYDSGRRRVTILARIRIDPAGRIVACTPERSSGIADLDALTCDLMQRRLRYAPARDASGRPIADVSEAEQTWTID